MINVFAFFFCKQKDADGSSSSSNDEEELKAAFSRPKSSPKGKKFRERTSPCTSDSDEKVVMGESSEKSSSFGKDHGNMQAATSKVIVQEWYLILLSSCLTK